MCIIIERSGPLTTVQDQGRIGCQDRGFSLSGAMDKRALTLANLLLSNDKNAAGLEVTLVGPKFTFHEDNCFVVTGADLKGTLNGLPLEINKVYAAKIGDVVNFPLGFPQAGVRSYICFAGGLDVPLLMGSRSTYLKGKMGGLEGRALVKGDKLKFLAPQATLPNLDKRCCPENFTQVYGGKEVEIRIVLGPQEDAFTSVGRANFLSEYYTVTPNSDRMGMRLDGHIIEHKGKADIISDGIAFGAVQVPKEGKPIIMMADHQSIGGYTKIANVISVDLPKVAQRLVGDTIKFRAVDVDEAQKLLRKEYEQFLALIEQWA